MLDDNDEKMTESEPEPNVGRFSEPASAHDAISEKSPTVGRFSEPASAHDAISEKSPTVDRFSEPATQESGVEMPKIIPFSTLARCGDEVWIETGGQIYRLRKTRQGKLILTK